MNKQDVRILTTNSADYRSNNPLAKAGNVLFVEKEDDETVAAFERSTTGETLTKQQRMQNDIGEYNKPVTRTDPRTKFKPDPPALREMRKRGKKTSRKPTGEALTQAFSKCVKKHHLINNLAQVLPGITFGEVARSDIDFAKADLQKIFSGGLNRATVTVADKDQVDILSMSKHLLVRVRVYSESTLAPFDSRAIPNMMSRKMVNKWNIRMMLTTRRIKVTNSAFEKCLGQLRDVPIQMGALVVPFEFFVIESSPYDIIIGLPTMIKLRARPDYHRMVLKVLFEGDSEILNIEYEREVGRSSEKELTSDEVGESNNDEESEEGLVLMLRDGKTYAPDCEEEELIDQKLCHQNQISGEGIESIVRKYPELIPD